MKTPKSHPIITRIAGDEHKREWLLLTPPRYYVHRFEHNVFTRPTDDFIGKWVVIDVESDFAMTKCWKTKRGAVNEFMRVGGAASADR